MTNIHSFLCQSIFNPHSAEAEKLYRIDHYFIIASSFILIVVIVLLIYISIRFYGKPDDPEPAQIGGNKKVETVMIGIPFLMVSFFLYLTIRTMNDTQPTVTNEKPDVIVTGHQWWWEVQYPEKDVVEANEIHLPVGRKILIELHSDDVIHDWWVPELGPKMDMEPGTANHLWITIHKPGIYYGACSEFCGKQHAWMRIRVVAQKPGDYQQWLAERKKPATSPSSELAITGASIFNRSTCANCHSIKGTEARGAAGPDLTHIASRKTLLTGLMLNNKKNLEKWISDPQSVKPGALMPKFIFKKDTINALAEYLSSLK